MPGQISVFSSRCFVYIYPQVITLTCLVFYPIDAEVAIANEVAPASRLTVHSAHANPLIDSGEVVSNVALPSSSVQRLPMTFCEAPNEELGKSERGKKTLYLQT